MFSIQTDGKNQPVTCGLNMKIEPANSTPASHRSGNESAKLVSLLALATGAVAIPQTSEADVIVTDLSASPVNIGFLANTSFIINNLPGTAAIKFLFGIHGSLSTESRWILAGQAYVGAYLHLKTNAFLVLHVPQGMTWNNIGGVEKAVGTVGYAYYNSHLPNSFSHDYLLFKFQDSTQGNALKYGWVDVSFNNSNLSTGEGPQLTIWRYAYDTTGAVLAAGAVPEPGSVSLLALGALALGAKGVRSWKRNRPKHSA